MCIYTIKYKKLYLIKKKSGHIDFRINLYCVFHNIFDKANKRLTCIRLKFFKVFNNSDFCIIYHFLFLQYSKKRSTYVPI